MASCAVHGLQPVTVVCVHGEFNPLHVNQHVAASHEVLMHVMLFLPFQLCKAGVIACVCADYLDQQEKG
jgi:hypothetical protein